MAGDDGIAGGGKDADAEEDINNDGGSVDGEEDGDVDGGESHQCVMWMVARVTSV